MSEIQWTSALSQLHVEKMSIVHPFFFFFFKCKDLFFFFYLVISIEKQMWPLLTALILHYYVFKDNSAEIMHFSYCHQIPWNKLTMHLLTSSSISVHKQYKTHQWATLLTCSFINTNCSLFSPSPTYTVLLVTFYYFTVLTLFLVGWITFDWFWIFSFFD